MNLKWFKAKQYGWGWTPVAWQGWLILIVYLLSIIVSFIDIDHNSHSVSDTMINFVPTVLFYTAFLIFICYQTGEVPIWQWGKKKPVLKKKK